MFASEITGLLAILLLEDEKASPFWIVAIGIVLLVIGAVVMHASLRKLQRAGIVARLRETPIK